MQKLLTLCKKIAESKSLIVLLKFLFLSFHAQICALKVALNMLKLPLRATFLPIRLALSGIFCIFAAKTSRLFNPFTI